jgi:GDP/UDP-N,N'-diacetylbacillosamine 2-epimerase (hydrolysing)
MRKICVFTSTRADYGLLRNLIREIANSPELSLQLLVSGTHLVANQGMTVNEIEADGFALDHCIDIELSDDSPGGICDSMGVAISRYGKVLETIQPNILVILGDRFESFCCAAAATVCRIPIAHIHGGESTVGAMDEAFRHSITKMAHLHFPCCDTYRQRIIQLGEAPDRVFDVGALGVESIKKTRLMTKQELETSIAFKLGRPFFLVTFHPVTLEDETAGEQFGQLLAALDQFQDHQCIFTQANADTDGRIINQMIVAYVESHSDRCMVIPSLGYLRYFSAMSLCEAVIGNSSSGILEAPVFKVPTINIGDRQKGRVRMESIIDCLPEKDAIIFAISKALSRDFVISLQYMQNPYKKSETAIQIKNILASTDLNSVIKKEFFDFRE